MHTLWIYTIIEAMYVYLYEMLYKYINVRVVVYMSVMDTGDAARACYNWICMSKQIMWLLCIQYNYVIVIVYVIPTPHTQHMQVLCCMCCSVGPHCCIHLLYTILGTVVWLFIRSQCLGIYYSWLHFCLCCDLLLRDAVLQSVNKGSLFACHFVCHFVTGEGCYLSSNGLWMCVLSSWANDWGFCAASVFKWAVFGWSDSTYTNQKQRML